MRRDRPKKYYKDSVSGWLYTIECYKGLDKTKNGLWKVKKFKDSTTLAYSSEAANPWQGFKRACRLLDKLAKKWGWKEII